MGSERDGYKNVDDFRHRKLTEARKIGVPA